MVEKALKAERPTAKGETCEMKNWKKLLACGLALAFAVVAFTGCSSLLNFATVQTDTDEAKALMKEIDPNLTYDGTLEYAAERLANWLTEEPLQLSAADGQFVRRVQLSADSGNMTADNVNDFIDLSTSGMIYLPAQVKIALTMNNEGNPYYDPGRLYVPAAEGAAQTLQSYAEGCSKMGAVYIQYSGETYVVALFM